MMNVQQASQRLTKLYQKGASLSTEEEFNAYLIVRFPATYAAITDVLKHLPPQKSILDLGAGPGTVWWSATALWDNLSVTAIESEARFIRWGQKIGTKAHWIQEDICKISHFDPHELVVFSYSLGEIPQKKISSLLQRCWRATKNALVIIEPGTPRGYQRVLLAREILIKLGAYVQAPCPHSTACPLKSSDWCHFSVRLKRSCAHRQAKSASLPFEDEKYSYLIVTKEKPTEKCSRILRPPSHHSGHVRLRLCTSDGIEEKIISRRQREFKKARKLKWGDAIGHE